LAALLVALLLPSAGRASIMLGQVDTFQDGTTQLWGGGPPPSGPVNVPTGGPDGGCDPFMCVMSSGDFGPGGRLTAWNRDQWSGNYLAAGVGTIEMDLMNPGTDPLFMRIGMKQGLGSQAPGYASLDPFVLPPDGAWYHAVFLLDDAHLTRINSDTLTLNDMLSNVIEFRLIENSDASLMGEQIAGQFGVDNILAGPPSSPAPAPEPGGLALALSGLPVLAACGYRRLRPGPPRHRVRPPGG
jgi:hypothetical protein